jgi:hypothetical protein
MLSCPRTVAVVGAALACGAFAAARFFVLLGLFYPMKFQNVFAWTERSALSQGTFSDD